VNDANPDSNAFPPLPAYLDPVCTRFESACQAAGDNDPLPRPEDYLGETSPPDRILLLGEQIALEVAYRCLRGEALLASAYQERDHSRIEGDKYYS
jgi:hypothetical protein